MSVSNFEVFLVYLYEKMENTPYSILRRDEMVRKEDIPELNTFTFLNPDFLLAKETYHRDLKLEKEAVYGNISENHGNEKE